MKNWKKAIAKLLVLSMAVSFSISWNGRQAEAAKKPKLSAKAIACTIGKTKPLKVANAKKAKISWKVKNKSIASIKKIGKYNVTVKGKKKGSTKIICKVKIKKKTYSFTCNVKVSAKKNVVTSAAPLISRNPNAVASVKPSISAEPSTSAKPSVSPAETFVPVVYKQTDFENGTEGFIGRFGAKVSVSDGGYEGKCLYVSGRNQTWQGAGLDVAKTTVPGATYSIVAYIKQMSGQDTEIKCSTQTGSTYSAVASVKDAKAGVWTRLEGTFKMPYTVNDYVIYFEIPGSATADFYIDSVVITQIETPPAPPSALPSLKDTYKDIFPYFGTCLNYNGFRAGAQMQSEEIMGFVQKNFNSFTLEDEMKPENVLGGREVTKITKSQALEQGYVIPDSYQEASVPQLNFQAIDRAMEIAYRKGIKMRAHVLMWHQQTSTWFFSKDYDGRLSVTEKVMDARLEFYVRTVMTHIMNKEKELTGENGSLVYAWDVVNEYLHRDNAPGSRTWMDIYGDLGLEPTYVKKAFELAYSELEKFGVQDKVTLFYNDYDTYFAIDELISLVNYINNGQKAKICGGIGMQSHVDVDRPTIAEYGAALDAFLATGLEIQITELDVTINFEHENDFVYKNEGQTDETQAVFMKAFMEQIVRKHKNRDQSVNPKGITGITFWGLYDSVSWRGECAPLLFKEDVLFPKPSFYSVIEAAKVWN